MKYFKDSEVLEIEDNKLKIIWNVEDNVEVRIFSLINNFEKLIGKVRGKNEFITKDYYENRRCLFILKAENYHYEIVGKRLITLDGANAFRDIGGYKSEDGRRVKWNTFYSSDRLTNLSDYDIQYIKDLKVKTILDLRSKDEVKENPDVEFSNLNYINISCLKTSKSFGIVPLLIRSDIASIDVEKSIIDCYKNMIFDNLALKKLIECIENEDSLPIVFHSSAGKDRVGLFSSIILSILGVSRKTIKKDYMNYNLYKKHINDSITSKFTKKIKNASKIKTLKNMLEVKEEYLDSVFIEIDKKYGSMDRFLEKEYGLTRKKRKELKNRFLY